IWEIGLMHGTHNSPSPQPSCPSSADCGLPDTSGMHFDKHTPSALPTDEVQAAGLNPPPALMIGSGRHTLCPSGHAVMALASAGSTSADGTQCAGPSSQQAARWRDAGS